MSEKTEPPSHKKLEDERKKGNLAKSKNILSTFIFCLILLYLYLTFDHFQTQFSQLASISFEVDKLNSTTPGIVLEKSIQLVASLTAGLLFCVIIGAFLGSLAQNKFLITFDPLKPKLESLDPIKGIKKLFSVKSLLTAIQLIVLSCILLSIVYSAIKSNLNEMISTVYAPISSLLTISGHLFLKIIFAAIAVYIVHAVLDYVMEKFFYIKNLKMSKDDLKREYKESEGDPHIKGKRKELHQEILQDEMMQNVKKSNVVIVNPEHYAIAITYEEGKHDLPVVVAKGQDGLALQIKKIAEQNNIPVLRNVKLARQLYDTSQMNQYIPSEMIEPIAEVLKWVKRVQDEKYK